MFEEAANNVDRKTERQEREIKRNSMGLAGEQEEEIWWTDSKERVKGK